MPLTGRPVKNIDKQLTSVLFVTQGIRQTAPTLILKKMKISGQLKPFLPLIVFFMYAALCQRNLQNFYFNPGVSIIICY